MKKLILIILSFIIVGLYSCGKAVGSGGDYIVVSSKPITYLDGDIDISKNHLCLYSFTINGYWRSYIDSIGKYRPGDDIRNKK